MGQKILRSLFESTAPQGRGGTQEKRGDGVGKLPSCAYLANPFVPYQPEQAETYLPEKAFIRGTLFPGLDLPLLGNVNETEKGDTGLAELQALDFAIRELALYLDTHEEDAEAAELFQSYAELYRSGVAKWEKEHGSFLQVNSAENGAYHWTQGPWPWELCANGEG